MLFEGLKELRSQSRLRYIADRVLQSSSDMFQKNKDETLDELSALGLRHVGAVSRLCLDALGPGKLQPCKAYNQTLYVPMLYNLYTVP